MPRAKGALVATEVLLLRAMILFPCRGHVLGVDGCIHISTDWASEFLGAADFQMLGESVKK